MKKILSGLLIVALLLSLSPAPIAEEAPTVRLGGLKGPTTMGLVKLLSDNEEGKTKNHYEFNMSVSPDEIVPKVLKGELDILAVPANMGSVLYQKTEGGVQMVAINNLGVLYLVDKGENIQTLSDLKGKRVYSTGKGATPAMVLSYLLAKEGLKMEEDVIMDWVSEPTEAVARLNAQEKGIALLPQPFVTVALAKVEGLRVALSMDELWAKADTDSRLVTAALIVRAEFAKEHPEAVANFLADYCLSAEYVNAHVEEAAKLVEKYGIVKAPIAQKALPQCNIVCITGEEMKKATDGYFRVLFEQNPKAIGGKLPGDDFYFILQEEAEQKDAARETLPLLAALLKGEWAHVTATP